MGTCANCLYVSACGQLNIGCNKKEPVREKSFSEELIREMAKLKSKERKVNRYDFV